MNRIVRRGRKRERLVSPTEAGTLHVSLQPPQVSDGHDMCAFEPRAAL